MQQVGFTEWHPSVFFILLPPGLPICLALHWLGCLACLACLDLLCFAWFCLTSLGFA